MFQKAGPGGGLSIIVKDSGFLATGPDGQRARSADVPEGAFRRIRGISPVSRGLARTGEITPLKYSTR